MKRKEGNRGRGGVPTLQWDGGPRMVNPARRPNLWVGTSAPPRRGDIVGLVLGVNRMELPTSGEVAGLSPVFRCIRFSIRFLVSTAKRLKGHWNRKSKTNFALFHPPPS